MMMKLCMNILDFDNVTINKKKTRFWKANLCLSEDDKCSGEM